MDKQKIIFATVFLVVTILLGTALYFVFFRQSPEPQAPGSTGGTQQPGQAFPSAGSGDIPIGVEPGSDGLPPSGQVPTQPGLLQPTSEQRTQRILSDEILSPTISSNRQVRFYNADDGHFYRVDQNGNLEQLSDQIFFNVDTVTWAPNQDEAILEYPDGANIYYNFETEKQVTLPRHWEDFSFSNEGNRIAAKSVGLAPENRWLVVSNPDGTASKLVEPLGENADKVTVDWSPNQQVVALSRTGDPLGANREEVLLIGQNGENFQSLVVEGRGIESQWSPTGDKLLYSVYSARNDFKPELWIVNTSPNNIGTGRQLLNIDTWANKCSFDSTNQRFVYCGVPQQLETGAGFQPQIADTIPDRLYRIDTQTGVQTEIPFDDDLSHTVNIIFTSEDGRRVYFTDKQNDGLFQVDL